MKQYLLFLGFILAGFIFSCDKVESPFPEDKEVSDTGLNWTDSAESKSNNGVRFALMEEFTGHTCTNCPKAARRITQLQDNKYGDTLIAIAIHLSDFAAPRSDDNPYKGAGPGAYYSDHRAQTENPAEHTVYYNQTKFGDLAALPKGMINRQGEATTENKWGQDLTKFFNNPGLTMANIHLMNYYDATAKTFQTKVIIEWLQDHIGDLNLQVQILEKSIIDWQLDGDIHEEFYEHKHMYRGAVNGAWGAALAANTAGNNDTIVYTRQIEPYLGVDFDATTDVINKDNFIIVAYIYQRDDMEVMQVNEAHLTGNH